MSRSMESCLKVRRPDRIGNRSVSFSGGKKTGDPTEKPTEPGETARTGIRSGSQRWEASTYPLRHP